MSIIQEAETAVWDTHTKFGTIHQMNFEESFEDSGLGRNISLLKELVNSTLETSSSTEDYVCSAHKLRNTGFQVDDEWWKL